MAGGADEVKTSVYSRVVIGRQAAFNLEFLLQVVIKLLVYVVHDGSEAVALVDLVTIPHRVHYCQLSGGGGVAG